MTHVFRSFCFFLSLVLLGSSARAQSVGYGDWQLHLPANRPLFLADAGDRIYVGTESSFYFLDKALNTTHVLSRRDGLSDVGIAGLDYDPLTKQTVVVYRNNNIDIIQPNGKVRNLNDVARKAISGTRTVNQVKVLGDRAYIATDFGLVVVNLTKLEISDTYSNIGPNGAVVQAYAATTAHDTLFVSTSAGILRGRLSSSTNLLDYNNWKMGPTPGNRTRHMLSTLNGRVHAACNPEGGVFEYLPNQNAAAGGTWRQVGYVNALRQIRATDTGLMLLSDNSAIQQIAYRNGLPVPSVLIPRETAGLQTLDALQNSDGSYYVADYGLGFRRIVPGAVPTVELFQPNGPQSSLAFNILADARSNKVTIFGGLYNDRYLPAGSNGAFYEYANGQWTNFTRQTLPSTTDFPHVRDFVRGTRTPDGTLYVGSYGDGLVKWNGVGSYDTLNAHNSALRNATANNNDKTCYIADLATDVDGSIWLTNRHGLQQTSGLFKLDPSTSPPTITSPAIFIPGMQILDRLALDDNGFVWASVSRKTDGSPGAGPGVIAVDPINNQARYFSSANGLPSNEIYDIVKDRTGDIWVATLLGAARLSGPSGAFYPETNFITPIVRRGEGAGYPALWNTAVRTVAVDGANRKWFGTDEGLWLFSADADEALLHFTIDNSPLPSNRIVDVTVNDRTGDVWVATDGGVVSYRGSATLTEGSPNCTKASPNPVRPDYTGVVGVSGLANNALVKITDVAGHLVYATTATGGTLTWNMTDANGQRVRSGMYLVLSSDADGNNTCVSKVAVLSK